MRASTYVALNSALLWRKAPRPLRLMVWSIIRSLPLLMSGLGSRWSTDPLRRLWVLWALTFHHALHLLHHSGLLYQSDKILDGQGGYHQANITAKAVLELTASPLLVKWQCIEAIEVLEPLSVLCYSLPSLGQLEELHLLGVPDAIWKIFREEPLPKCLPRHRLLSLLKDGFGADPPMLCLSREHVYRERQHVLHRAHFGVIDALQVLQPLVCGVRTGLSIKLCRVVLQKVLQASLPDCRSWFTTKHRDSRPVLLQLAEGLHVLSMSILNSYPRSLHLLHHCLLLLKRRRLSLHGCLMLLLHRSTLLCHRRYHLLYCSGDVRYVSLG